MVGHLVGNSLDFPKPLNRSDFGPAYLGSFYKPHFSITFVDCGGWFFVTGTGSHDLFLYTCVNAQRNLEAGP